MRGLVVVPVALLVWAACGEGSSTTGVDDALAQRCRRAIDAPLECIECLEAECCVEVARCGEDLRCKPCIQPGAGTECTDPPPQAAVELLDCKLARCLDACPPAFIFHDDEADCDGARTRTEACAKSVGKAFACDPILQTDCGAGEACDAVEGGFACRPVGAAIEPCEPCGHTAFHTCAPGLHCIGVCAPYCCDQGDCAFGARCERSYFADPNADDDAADSVGVCVPE